jgi:hypothetical protein
MLKRNNIATGLLAALILPAITWFVFGFLFKNKTVFMNKPVIPYLIAIALNLFIIKFLFKKGDDQTGTGMIICTFLLMIVVFLFKSIYQP